MEKLGISLTRPETCMIATPCGARAAKASFCDLPRRCTKSTNACGIEKADAAHVENQFFGVEQPELLQETVDSFQAQFSAQASDQGAVCGRLMNDVQSRRLHRPKG